ncbi:MAG: PBP1A family penicillin-binding protein [Alphaproteobacteria bacterium]
MKRKNGRKSKKGSWGGLLKLFLTLALWGFIAVGGVLLWYSQDLPNVEDVETASKRPSIVFLTQDHQEIAVDGDLSGEIITLKQVPKPLIQALLATEDQNFYSHHGVDWFGILRAALRNLVAGRFAQGGSTLTQQLAKNLFLSPERSISRKVKEFLLAFWLEHHFTKDEILTIYLNRVYLGRQTYGIDAAAQQYFGKLLPYLNTVESAVIVGLLKAPSRYGGNKKLLKERAAVVLGRMKEVGYLTDVQYEKALKSLQTLPITIGKRDNNVRYFTDWISQEAGKYINTQEDIIIITTLDKRLQQKASHVLRYQLESHGEEKKIQQAAFFAMDHRGAVKAMVGGGNYNVSQFNIAVQAQRQPGSAFKPIIYLAALEAGYDPDNLILSDDSYKNKNWTVENFGWEAKGEASMRDALVYSLNTPAVRLAQMVGVKKIIDVCKRVGFKTVPPHNLSIALGTSSSNLLELTTMMAIFANHGKKVEPYGILEIRSMDGKIFYKRPESDPEDSGVQLFDPSVIRVLEDMLQEVIERGTGKNAYIPGVVMRGKTGTSQDFRDAWFVGYTPELVGGVWMGNPNYSPMNRVVGGVLPSETWRKIISGYSQAPQSIEEADEVGEVD